MYLCELCNYLTTSKHSLQIHYKSKKHLTNKTDSPFLDFDNFICMECNKEFKFQTGLLNHRKLFHDNIENDDIFNDIDIQLKHKLEMDKIKTEHQLKLEIEKLKFTNKLKKKDYQKKLEIKKMENKQLQLQVKDKTETNINQVNNIQINNNLNISKVQYLNLNFSDVIDINTFIENYKNQYGLSNKQTETLLDNYRNGGINSCITTLVYYLKESAIQQYKELKGKEISMPDIILPFILSDKYIREHFEKNVSGDWDKTSVMDNIKKIVGITDDHVYKHHNTYMYLSDSQKKKLVNGVLKASGYSRLNTLSSPDIYKKKEISGLPSLVDILEELTESESDSSKNEVEIKNDVNLDENNTLIEDIDI
jgi:hypothetical protein